METQDSESGSSDQDGGKVVPLLRDWVGPTEELVPFGAAARGPAAPDALSEVKRPPRAEDFWGETSADMQDALEAPAPPAPRVVSAPRSPLAGSGRQQARVRIGMTKRPRGLAVAVAAATAVVFGVIAAVLARPETGVPTAGHAARAPSRPGRLGSLKGQHLLIAANPFGARRASRRARPAITRHMTIRKARTRSGAAPHSGNAAPQPPSYVASAATNFSRGSSSRAYGTASSVGEQVAAHAAPVASIRAGTGGGAPAPTVAAQALPATRSTTSSSAQRTTSSSASTNTAAHAFGQSGALGPGSSPNG